MHLVDSNIIYYALNIHIHRNEFYLIRGESYVLYLEIHDPEKQRFNTRGSLLSAISNNTIISQYYFRRWCNEEATKKTEAILNYCTQISIF